MKRILFFLVVLLSVWSLSYADQTLNGRQPREWRHSTDQKPLENKDFQGDTTAFTNVLSSGHNNIGNPGYVALLQTPGATGENTQQITYYLWVNGSGKLMIASFATLQSYASFPYGDWRAPQMPVGTVVGSQS